MQELLLATRREAIHAARIQFRWAGGYAHVLIGPDGERADGFLDAVGFGVQTGFASWGVGAANTYFQVTQAPLQTAWNFEARSVSSGAGLAWSLASGQWLGAAAGSVVSGVDAISEFAGESTEVKTQVLTRAALDAMVGVLIGVEGEGGWAEYGLALGAERRAASTLDAHFASQAEALAESLRRHGIVPDLVEFEPMYGKHPNLIGPKGEPWEMVLATIQNWTPLNSNITQAATISRTPILMSCPINMVQMASISLTRKS